MKVPIVVMFLALYMVGCQKEFWEIHFGPLPQIENEQVNMENSDEKNIKKDHC